jgi:multiple sugar transport system permease protein
MVEQVRRPALSGFERSRGSMRLLAARVGNSDASFVLPAVIFMVALVLVPTVYAGYLSLTHWNLTEGTPKTFIGLRNYRELLGEHRFWASLLRTLIFAAASTILTLGLGFLLALLLNRPLPGRNLFRSLLIVPMVVTPVVVGLTWRFMYDPNLGMANWLLGLLGVKPIAFLGQTTTAFSAVIATDVWEYTPFALLILLAGLESLPPEPFEAAQIDGASRLATLWHITLPMMKGPLAVALLFRLMFSFNVFDTLYVMTGGGPGRSSETLVMYAYRIGFTQWEVGKAAAAALISLVLITVIAKLIIRTVRLQAD